MPFVSRSGTIVGVVCVAILIGLCIGFGLARRYNARSVSDDQAPVAAATATTTATTDISAAPKASPTALFTRIQVSTPTPIPTDTPAPISTPTSTPTASPTPAPTTVPVIAILEQVAEAETALRSGELEATLDHSEGVRSFSTVRFDLGDEQQVPRLHMTSIYESAEGPQTFERIMIGTTAWERQPDGAWIEVSGQVVVWDQVQTFLPHARSGANPQLTVASDTAELRWDDPSRDADVTLLLDPDTNILHELRRLIRTTGAVLTVRYIGWNTPVEITPPEGT